MIPVWMKDACKTNKCMYVNKNYFFIWQMN